MSNDTENIQLTDENVITEYEFARWASLYEAIELIADKCKDRKIDFDGPAGLKFIKPLDILEYINGRTDSMIVTIRKSRVHEREHNLEKISSMKKHIYDFSHDDLGLPI